MGGEVPTNKGGWGKAPTSEEGLGGKAPSLENVCLDYIFCLMDQMWLG